MLQPPPLSSALRYPVTALVVAEAVAATAWWWTGHSLDAFDMNVGVWEKWELWRALTSTLPHVNFLHLAFNLYWLWALGTVVERVYGPAWYLGILVSLAFGSSLAQFALLGGGVGLSGVGYGLWGLLWVLAKRDARFAGAMDSQTSHMFVGWFFLCIVLTLVNVMPVANIAHGAGALLGALLGVTASGPKLMRAWGATGVVAVMVLALAGATVWWPWVNLSGSAQVEIERAGVAALERGDNAAGEKLLTIASKARGERADVWYNLGVAYHRLGKADQALAAFEHAARMPNATSEFKKVAEEMKLQMRQAPR